MKQQHEYSRVGTVPHFARRLILGKIALFVGLIATILMLSFLQERSLVGAGGTYFLVALLIAQGVALFTWDFAPHVRCPDSLASHRLIFTGMARRNPLQ
jgi:hypothetical protein